MQPGWKLYTEGTKEATPEETPMWEPEIYGVAQAMRTELNAKPFDPVATDQSDVDNIGTPVGMSGWKVFL
jgi:hypothetical protein